MVIQILKAFFRRPLLLMALVIFSFLLLICLTQETNKNSELVSKVSQGLPTRLIIPVINVDTRILHLGVLATGEMEVPDNVTEVSWFKLGPRPGEKGSAVIGGHFDGKNGEAGVFFNLDKLKTGDKLSIEDDQRKSITFVVRESSLYDSGYADNVFSGSDSAQLNLITCDGAWDEAKKNYSKRLVVFADKLGLDK